MAVEISQAGAVGAGATTGERREQPKGNELDWRSPQLAERRSGASEQQNNAICSNFSNLTRGLEPQTPLRLQSVWTAGGERASEPCNERCQAPRPAGPRVAADEHAKLHPRGSLVNECSAVQVSASACGSAARTSYSARRVVGGAPDAGVQQPRC